MLKFTDCTITSTDGLLEYLEGALIVATGQSPNSTVAVSVYEPHRRRFARRDQLTHASIKGRGSHWEITGRSRMLIDEVGLRGDEAVVTLKVTAKGGCDNCGG